MRIVVTGATGNIGTAVVRRLSRDDHELVGLARRVPDNPGGAGSPAVTWESVDLTRVASARLADTFAGADAVVHLAWAFQPSHDLDQLRELGVGGTRRVVEAVQAAGVRQLVHLSSVGAYSPREDDDPVTESWPTMGVPTSRYSRHKAAAERILDTLEAMSTATTVTRLRPGIVGQREAGSALLRYGVPGLVPARVLGWLPVLPLDRRLRIPMVHADDVADAVARVIDQRAGGAFNLAADPPLTAAAIAAGLGARLVHVPSALLRPLVSAGWHLRLQQLDTGWLDMAFAVPLLDTTRARTELGWSPSRDAEAVFAEVEQG
ncbi:MAG: NAD-dependent epimerase/dehydratase family protein [Nocardioides sp.]|nr:NAD-dependent epimerase/dehydratase family protein [Nocardioides sp.]